MADKVLWLPGRHPRIVDVEFQSGPDPDLLFRLMGYHGMLYERHKVPIRSVLVLLRPKADSPRLTGRLTVRGAFDFEYTVVRPWLLPVERILACGLGVLPLAPLCDLDGTDPAEVVYAMDRRFRAEAPPAEVERLWAASWVLMGLKYPSGLVDQLLEGVSAMKESSTYQAAVREGLKAGLREGRKEGRQQGRQEGRQEGLEEGRQEGLEEGLVEEARQLVLRLGGKWLGDPDGATLDYIRGLGDREALEAIAERLRDARTWDDALRGS